MGRILFLSAVAYLAYRYIGRSNAKHGAIASSAGTDVLPPAPAESAALAPAAPVTAELSAPRSSAAEPDPQVTR